MASCSRVRTSISWFSAHTLCSWGGHAGGFPRTEGSEGACVPGKKISSLSYPQPTTGQEVRRFVRLLDSTWTSSGQREPRRQRKEALSRAAGSLGQGDFQGYLSPGDHPPSGACIPLPPHHAGCVCTRPVSEPSLPPRPPGTIFGRLWLSRGFLRINELQA